MTTTPGRRPTYEEAVANAGAAIAEGRRIRDSLPAAEAARRAHHAGGPSVAELEVRILAMRADWPEHLR